jgi:hypothetical protein
MYTFIHRGVKVKFFFPVHDMRARKRGGGRSIVPRVCNLGPIWRGMVNFPLWPHYPRKKGTYLIGGCGLPAEPLRKFWRKKYLSHTGIRTPDISVPSPVTVWTVYKNVVCLCVCVCVYIYTHHSVRTYIQTSFYPSYLLTPCSTVVLEKLIGTKLVKKFPVFYGNRRFITAFTSARHLSLSWARSIQSMLSHPTSLRFIFGRTKVPRSNARVYVSYQRQHLRRGVFSTSPNKKDGGPTLVSCPRLLIQYIFATTHHIGGRSSIRNLKARHAWWQEPTYHEIFSVYLYIYTHTHTHRVIFETQARLWQGQICLLIVHTSSLEPLGYTLWTHNRSRASPAALSTDILMYFNRHERFYKVFPSTANMQIWRTGLGNRSTNDNI